MWMLLGDVQCEVNLYLGRSPLMVILPKKVPEEVLKCVFVSVLFASLI